MDPNGLDGWLRLLQTPPAAPLSGLPWELALGLGSPGVLAALLGVGLRVGDARRFPKNLGLLGLALAAATLVGGALPSREAATAACVATSLIYATRGPARWLWSLPAALVAASAAAAALCSPLETLGSALAGSGIALAVLRPFEVFHGLATRPARRAERPADRPLSVALVAGEASADLYGARVLHELRRREPRLRAFGIGGERLRAAGLEACGDASQLEVVGFTAVLTSLVTIVRLYLRMLRRLHDERPDALICIDLPDFNFMLALQARGLGVPVLFDISPQFWAWRPGRIRKLADRISKMIVAFPFEVAYYEGAGVPVAFHGHPLLEVLESRFASRAAARRHFGLPEDGPVCVLAPGSRRSELAHHLDPIFGAAARLQCERPELRFVTPLAPKVDEAEVQRAAAAAGVEVACTRGSNFDLFQCADFGLICSGTATLEAALAGLPMVIFYRSNWTNALLAELLVRTDRIGLPNIVLDVDTLVFPERTQHRASAAGLAAAALPLLRDEAARARQRDACTRVRKRLTGGATSQAVADEILELARS